MRLTKTVDGVKHTYLYENGLLVQETRGNEIFDYSYDANGSIRMLSYRETEDATPTYYYYALNTRGDVIGLYDASGALIVKYTYDPWGNSTSVTDASGTVIDDENDIANTQPFRYRSYYFDTDSGFYYLQSRYYDPVTHRFINSDSLMDQSDVLGYNLYAYCMNNPITSSDPLGLCVRAWELGLQGPCPGQGKPGCMDNWLRDVSEEVDTALMSAAEENIALRNNLYAGSFNINFENIPLNEMIMYTNFYYQVNHEEPWDIKREDSWIKTIGTPYPGFGVIIIYHDTPTTVEKLGNYTYGYLGCSSKIPLPVLLAGSYYAADMPKEGPDLHNELGDWGPIVLGYIHAYYKNN